MTDLSPHVLLDAAFEIAQLASNLMLQFSAEVGAHRKSDGTLVTHLDLAVYACGLGIWGVSLVGVLAFLLLREVLSAVRDSGSHRNGCPIATSPITAPDDEHFIMTTNPKSFLLPPRAWIMGAARCHC